MKNNTRMLISILVILLAASFSLYLASLTRDRFGFYHDDGIYVVTAKALATGEGYRIISLPYEPAQTKYPPFYPFVLSLIWRVYPEFPENLLPMMFLSILATVTFLALTWGYLVKKNYTTGWQALLVVTLTAVNWRTVILATNLLSEMLYASLSVAGLWLAERYEKEESSWTTWVSLGVVLGLAFLTRTSGIALLIVVPLYYLVRRKFGKASFVLTLGGLLVLVWLGWCYDHRTTFASGTFAYYTSYLQDVKAYVTDSQTLLGVIVKNALMLIFSYVPFVSLGLDHLGARSFPEGTLIIISFTFLFVVAGFFRHISAGLRLLHLYVIFYLVIHLLWPYTAYDRFLMPILPFLLLFLITELEYLITLLRNDRTPAGQLARKFSFSFVGAVLLLLVCSGLYNYISGIHRLLVSKEVHAVRASENAKAIGWINRNTNPSDVLLCYPDPLYFLYTGRKSIRYYFALKERFPTQNEISMDEEAEIVFRIIKESNARYLIVTSSDFEYELQRDVLRKNSKVLLEQHPQTFIRVFDSGNGSAIYRINTS